MVLTLLTILCLEQQSCSLYKIAARVNKKIVILSMPRAFRQTERLQEKTSGKVFSAPASCPIANHAMASYLRLLKSSLLDLQLKSIYTSLIVKCAVLVIRSILAQYRPHFHYRSRRFNVFFLQSVPKKLLHL